MNKKDIIILQLIFVVVTLFAIYFLYPRANMELNKDSVNIYSINANVVQISKNPDFSNSIYLDFSNRNNLSFNLNPGVYYWKSYNKVIKGLRNKFVIDSVVGMNLERDSLMNAGNVKIIVTKNKDGTFMGNIILDSNESKVVYGDNFVGGQI